MFFSCSTGIHSLSANWINVELNASSSWHSRYQLTISISWYGLTHQAPPHPSPRLNYLDLRLFVPSLLCFEEPPSHLLFFDIIHWYLLCSAQWPRVDQNIEYSEHFFLFKDHWFFDSSFSFFHLFKKLYIHINVNSVMCNCFCLHISVVFTMYYHIYYYIHAFQISWLEDCYQQKFWLKKHNKQQQK